MRFTDAQRRRLAEKAKRLGKVLNDIASIVTPHTLMAWHRKLIATKWNHVEKRGPGRPRMMSEISALIVRMASENGTWGYTRIQGALANLGHKLARGAVANILKEYGIGDAAPCAAALAQLLQRADFRCFLDDNDARANDKRL